MKDNSKNRVVITGIGPITSVGKGKEEFWANTLNCHTNIQEVPEIFEKNYTFKSRFYAPFPKIELQDYNIPSKLNFLMGETTKLAVISTKLAFADAGFDVENEDFKNSEYNSQAMVILGIGICSLKGGFDAFAAHTFGDHPELLEEYGISARYNRLVIPSTMPDSATSWISILFGIHNENFTMNASCASGTYAIGESYRRIRDGYTKMVVAGGVEFLNDPSGTIMRGFDTLGTLTKSENGIPMPFSRNRSGFLFSEGGGCVLILEELNSALKRNADIYAEIVNYDTSSDAHNMVQIDNSGKQIKRIINSVKEDHKVDYFNTHGTATLLNDEFEKNLIQELFGDQKHQPFINSSKGALGHTIGASGALEAAITALSIKNSKIHKNISEDIFENLNLVTETIDTDIQCALSTSYGFGGHNAALLLKRFDGY